MLSPKKVVRLNAVQAILCGFCMSFCVFVGVLHLLPFASTAPGLGELEAKLVVSVNVNKKEFVCVSPVIGWQPVLGACHPVDSGIGSCVPAQVRRVLRMDGLMVLSCVLMGHCY